MKPDVGLAWVVPLTQFPWLIEVLAPPITAATASNIRRNESEIDHGITREQPHGHVRSYMCTNERDGLPRAQQS